MSIGRQGDRIGQYERKRRRRHTRAGTDEQFVAEKASQFGEAGTDGRLADPKPLGGRRDLAQLKQCVQHHEQVQVQSFNIHNSYNHYSKNRYC